MKKELLYFITYENHKEKIPAMATLAWIAKEAGVYFDAYIAKRSTGTHYICPVEDLKGIGIDYHKNRIPVKASGKFYCSDRNDKLSFANPNDGVSPYFGESTAEQFYYILNAFDVKPCSMKKAERFHYELSAFGKEFLSLQEEEDEIYLYKDICCHYGIAFPKEAVALNKGNGEELYRGICDHYTLEVEKSKGNLYWIEPYLYPEIYYRKALGFSVDYVIKNSEKLKREGIKKVITVLCTDSQLRKLQELDFEIEIVDILKADDNYGTITRRIADRWLDKAKAVAFSDPVHTACFIPFNCDEDILTLFDRDFMNFAKVVADYADKTGSDIVYGRQVLDDFLMELAKHDKVMPIFDPYRPSMLIKRKLPMTQIKTDKVFWEDEYTDAELKEHLTNNDIAVALISYSADLRHVSAVPNLFQLISLAQVRFGLSLNALWFTYQPEWMQNMLIPLNNGGLFPLVEPLLGGIGLGSLNEAEGCISLEMRKRMYKKSLGLIERYLGEENRLRGAYPWKDTVPAEGKGPQFQPYIDVGLEYCITEEKAGENPQVIYEDGNFIALNRTIPITAESMKNPVSVLKTWEERLVVKERPNWINFSFDLPLWCYPPVSLNMMEKMLDVFDYVKYGGNSGKLFDVKPRELIRYARMVKSSEQGR